MNDNDKTYYKATDKDMKCRGYQFELNKWSKPVEGDLFACKNGYHFCEHPSGVWAYYSAPGTRVFKCLVRDAKISKEPGASAKSVARQIMLIQEVNITGYCNTGNYNTGYCNTGYCNTGYCNTGNGNVGDYNTGDYNTGDHNTGDRNTGNCNTGNGNVGDYNTGNRNTGYRNTGNYNTGYCNTGYGNTGYGNVGDYNTGDYNVGSYHSGAFNIGNAPFLSFGIPCDRGDFPWRLAEKLFKLLSSTTDETVDVSEYLAIPNATEYRIRDFHRALIGANQENGYD